MTSPSTLAAFATLDLRIGTVRRAWRHPKARKPAFVLEIDFGPLGMRTSSAQLVENYTADDLVGRQVVAVTNFPPRRIAGVESQVLVLAAVGEGHGTILLGVERAVADGTAVA